MYYNTLKNGALPAVNNMQLPGTKLPPWMLEPTQINPIWFIGGAIILFLLLKK